MSKLEFLTSLLQLPHTLLDIVVSYSNVKPCRGKLRMTHIINPPQNTNIISCITCYKSKIVYLISDLQLCIEDVVDKSRFILRNIGSYCHIEFSGDEIFVVRYESRKVVNVYDMCGVFVRQWSVNFYISKMLSCDTNNILLVKKAQIFDKDHCMAVFNRNGKFLYSFGERDPHFPIPTVYKWINDSVIICDYKIYKIYSNGTCVGKLNLDPSYQDINVFDFPYYFSLSPLGDFYYPLRNNHGQLTTAILTFQLKRGSSYNELIQSRKFTLGDVIEPIDKGREKLYFTSRGEFCRIVNFGSSMHCHFYT